MILKCSRHEARASTWICLVTDTYAEAGGLAGLCPRADARTGASGAAREEVGPEVAKKRCCCSCQGSSLQGSPCYWDTFAVSSSESEEKQPQQQAHWVFSIPMLPTEIAHVEKERYYFQLFYNIAWHMAGLLPTLSAGWSAEECLVINKRQPK